MLKGQGQSQRSRVRDDAKDQKAQSHSIINIQRWFCAAVIIMFDTLLRKRKTAIEVICQRSKVTGQGHGQKAHLLGMTNYHVKFGCAVINTFGDMLRKRMCDERTDRRTNTG